jgi:CDP-diacylglycerol--serine O-phosphatidyltransferase
MTKRRHFSMLREFKLADFLTLGNGFSGAGAILCLFKYVVTSDRTFLWIAFALFPIALVCDVLDGRVARLRSEASLLGQELDSLADCVSFGVAPAVLAFALGFQGGWDMLVLVYFVGCGISRLARYNATAALLADETGKVKHFEGTPIPTSLVLVATLAVLVGMHRVNELLPLGAIDLGPAAFHPLVLMFAASGTAMISKTLRIPKP